MHAYSLDLRTHLLQALDSGVSKAEAARVFGVSVRTIDRYLRRLDETGDLAATPIPGRRRHITREQHDALMAQLQAHRDATLVEHCRLWQETHGVSLSLATMSRAIARLGWTWKKSHWWPPSAMRRSARSGERRWLNSTLASSSSSMSRVPTAR